jgi:uncharacterized membrane protein YraQ (UPF0718 family)
VVVLVVVVGALVVYKAVLFDPTIFPAFARAFVDTLNYLAWVLVALGFGVVIGALTRAVVPMSWMSRALSGNDLRARLIGALAGAPLMLCSCSSSTLRRALTTPSVRGRPDVAWSRLERQRVQWSRRMWRGPRRA